MPLTIILHIGRNGKGTGCVHATNQLPVLYLILRKGAGVDAGVGRAYGVRDFWYFKVFSRALGEEGNGAVGT